MTLTKRFTVAYFWTKQQQQNATNLALTHCACVNQPVLWARSDRSFTVSDFVYVDIYKRVDCSLVFRGKRRSLVVSEIMHRSLYEIIFTQLF